MMRSLLLLALCGLLACKQGPDENKPDIIVPGPALPVQVWTTSADQAALMSSRTQDFSTSADDRHPIIAVDTLQALQPIEGFGFTLTGGSALLIHQMPDSERAALLKELFSTEANGIGVSYLRMGVGSTDLDPEVFSYNDLPTGNIDPDLLQFSIARDEEHLIPVLKEILAIAPDLHLMGSPWSPPTWMKTNGSSIGGRLKTEYYAAYAEYFVKYIQAYQAHGIRIDAITPQNEPLHGGNNPSMEMSAAEQAAFIRDHLGPAFQQAGIDTKIIVWDHNCDRPDYPIEILDDPAAKAFVHGSAFHLYAGTTSALSEVHEAHPDRALYFTEQWTGRNGTFDGDLQWHVRNVIIGTTRNWSRVALEWNLANDPDYALHTPGGCTECKGALTISGASVSRNVAYYVVGQVAKFVPSGSVRLNTAEPAGLPSVAFLRPDGTKVLLVLNEGSSSQSFNIQAGSRWIRASIPAKSVSTWVWK